MENTFGFYRKAAALLTTQNFDLNFVKSRLQNSAGERTSIKAHWLYALSFLVRSLWNWENAIHATIESIETYTNYKEKREEILLSPARKDSIPMF